MRPNRGLAWGKTRKRPGSKVGKGQVRLIGSCLRSGNGLKSVQRNGLKLDAEG
jgi:hypothetical protein